jgi:hypothetical protein
MKKSKMKKIQFSHAAALFALSLPMQLCFAIKLPFSAKCNDMREKYGYAVLNSCYCRSLYGRPTIIPLCPGGFMSLAIVYTARRSVSKRH